MKYRQDSWQSCLCDHAVLAQSTGGKHLLWVANRLVPVMSPSIVMWRQKAGHVMHGMRATLMMMMHELGIIM